MTILSRFLDIGVGLRGGPLPFGLVRALPIAVMVWFAGTAPVLADEMGEPIIRVFSPKEYGGNNQIWSIAQDKRGVIYLGTSTGLLEYDGQKARSIVDKVLVRSMDVAPDNRIFVGLVGDVGYLAPDAQGRQTYYSLKDKIPPDQLDIGHVWVTRVTQNGVYFSGNEKTYRWHDDQIEVLPFGNAKMARIGNDLYFTVRGEGICKLTKSEKSCFGKSLADDATYRITQLSRSFRENELIIVSRRTGLHFISLRDGPKTDIETAITKFENEADEYLKRHIPYDVAWLNNNEVAFGTLSGGIVVLNSKGKLVQIVNEKRGLNSNTVLVLNTDRNGNLWAGTRKGFAFIDFRSPLTFFGTNSNLKTVQATIRYEGDIYAGTYAQGPKKLEPFELGVEPDIPRFELLDGPVQLYGFKFLNVSGNLLVASNNLRIIRDGKVNSVLPSRAARYMCDSKHFKGRLYTAVAGGNAKGVEVFSYRTRTANAMNGPANLEIESKGLLPGIDEQIARIDEDGDGNLWLSTMRDGLILVTFKSENHDELDITRYGKKHGLPNLTGNRVWLDNGAVMVATEAGILRYERPADAGLDDAGFVLEYRAADSEVLKKQSPRSSGSLPYQIWSLVPCGENRWATDPLYRYGILRRDSDGKYHSLTRPFQGLPNQTGLTFIDDDEVFWIPTREGLFRYDPRIEKDYDAPYMALIRSAMTKQGREIFKGTHYEPESKKGNHFLEIVPDQPQNSIPTLEYEVNGITFEFSASFYEHMDKTSFQVLLHGFEKGWSDWSKESRKEYNNLPEGRYRFDVRARNIFGTLSRTASYRFKILPPWYRTVFAYIGYVLGFVLLIAGLAQLITLRSRAAQKRLERIVKMRTAEVVEQKDETERQMVLVEQARHELWGEMELAKKIQTTLLPSHPHIEGYEVFGYMKTADEVGGDYYDVLNIGGRDWLIIGDVSGHGVTAGLLMMMAQTSIQNAISCLGEVPLDEILSRVNTTLVENIRRLGETKYMTITLMLFEPNGTIHYSGLHQDMLVRRQSDGRVDVIETRGIWLAVVEDISGMNAVDSLSMDPGDTLFLFTDGLVEAMDGDGKMYGSEKLQRVFAECGHKPGTDIRDHFLESLKGYKIDDDVTMLVVTRKGV